MQVPRLVVAAAAQWQVGDLPAASATQGVTFYLEGVAEGGVEARERWRALLAAVFPRIFCLCKDAFPFATKELGGQYVARRLGHANGDQRQHARPEGDKHNGAPIAHRRKQ